jgi:perosamine synthetase
MEASEDEPFLPVSQPSLGLREEALVLDAVRSGWVSGIGPYVEQFEGMFAEFCGATYALAVCNGTAGLHLALAALGVGRGNEVIVPDLTFVATANAVAYTGATPVLADVDPDTLCIDPASVEARLTDRTKAIIPVHLFGHPADMDPILELAAARGIAVVEDAAEALGAEYKGRRVGGLGCCGIFSFYGNKVMTTGEGGMLVTNDRLLYERAQRLHGHSMSSSRRYWHDEIGFNYRMTNLQAALGVAQMERIDAFLERRRQVMAWYEAAIPARPGIRLNRVKNWAKSAYWMVCLEVDSFDEDRRQSFMVGLKDKGIETRPYFCALSSMTKADIDRVGAAVADLLAELESSC